MSKERRPAAREDCGCRAASECQHGYAGGFTQERIDAASRATAEPDALATDFFVLLADAAQRFCPELKRYEAEAYAYSRLVHDTRAIGIVAALRSRPSGVAPDEEDEWAWDRTLAHSTDGEEQWSRVVRPKPAQASAALHERIAGIIERRFPYPEAAKSYYTKVADAVLAEIARTEGIQTIPAVVRDENP